MGVITIGREALGDIESRRPAGDGVKRRSAHDRPQNLGDHIGRDIPGREAPACREPECDGRVEVAAGDMANGVGHGQNAEAKGERHPKKADADLWKSSRDDRAAATCERQPECADSLGQIFTQIHLTLQMIRP